MKAIFFLALFLIGTTLAELDVSNLENIDDTILKEKCDARGGNGTYKNVQNAREKLQTCLENLIDIDTFKKEIEDSKKTGSMDEVFGKYCKKRPEIKTCVDAFLEKMKLCLIEDEKKNLDTVLNLFKELGEFACYKDGDRIAMFVAEDGPECIKAHVEGIKTCVNNTLKISSPANSVDSLPNFLDANKVCKDLSEVQPCIVKELEKCENTTPANVVDSVFRFIRKKACKTNKQRRSVRQKRSINLIPVQLQRLIDAFVKYTESKCRIYKGEKEIKRLQETLNETQICIKSYIKQNFLFIVNESALDNLKAKIVECSESFIEASENCLPKKEKYFPKFSQQIMNGLVNIVIKYKNNITVFATDNELQKCLQKFKVHDNRQALLNCYETELSKELSDYSMESVCQRLIDAGKCVTQAMKEICVKDISINRFKDEFIEVFTQPCSDLDNFYF